ncbi:UvrD-helicase domain-containing protein [candidate division KSB1 bacterium]|nr:UvrD-helicase domain-containing protein [candidate division KSB1 bacterium]
MKFYADLHLHSHYSRATSKQLNLEHLSKWGQLKGIHVVGTGDFVHPGWLDELRKKLEPAEAGLFKLKKEFAELTQPEVPKACAGEVRFMLTVEISSIYKRLDKVRKIHNVVFAPSFDAALKLQARLEAIGNIRSDGRPILGLDSRDLLEIVLATDPLAFLVPAHIWTPWFAVLGSKGGFDSMEDCFADLTPHIFAVETGLSSDPPMNWRLKQLDRFVLVSNSDAHSPAKLAREANLFDTELSYPAIYRAWKEESDRGFLGTMEFFPEEGKYHFDGHRECKTRLHPQETAAHQGNCPVCGKPVTVGVMARVEELADRPEGERPPRWRPYTSIIPLPEVIGDARGQAATTKGVNEVFERLLKQVGNELHILQEAPLEEIKKYAGEVVAEGIRRMRKGEVQIAAGYDGEYGTIHLFTDEERKELERRSSAVEIEFDASAQQHPPGPPQGGHSVESVRNAAASPLAGGLRGVSPASKKRQRRHVKKKVEEENDEKDSSLDLDFSNGVSTPAPAQEEATLSSTREAASAESSSSHGVVQSSFPADKTSALPLLNPSQQRAVQHSGSHLLIVAGPGTGKTHTLVHRILHIVEQGVSPEAVLAITFTNKAAEEMQRRLHERLGKAAQRLTTGTFHAFCLNLLRAHGGTQAAFEIIDEEQRKEIAKNLWPEAAAAERQAWLEEISLQKATLNFLQARDRYAREQMYQDALRRAQLWDFDDILLEAIALIENDKAVREQVRGRYRWLFVDEYQDLNPAQHRLLKLLAHEAAFVTAIGDPNQAIYGFRGSEVSYFSNFAQDFSGAVEMRLEENYRSGANILSASGQVIEHGEESFTLPLSAALLTEGRLTIYAAPTEKAEAEYVVHQIEKMVGGTSLFSQDSRRVERAEEGARSFGDFAIFYRLNALRGPLEEALQRSGMPYQISGDVPLLQRDGVLPLAALLRHAAGLHFQTKHLVELIARLTPGFGEVLSQRMLKAFDTAQPFELEKILRFAEVESLGAKVRAALEVTQQCLLAFEQSLQQQELAVALESFYQAGLIKTFLHEHAALYENWQRVLSLARRRESARALCDTLALERASDHFEAHAEKIAMMTLHASKGLEFPVVFIVGCEEHLTPMQLETLRGEPAEERRLFYVGMTRAKEQLYLLRAMKRRLFGKLCEHAPSRFLADIEEQLKAYEHWHAKPQKQVEKIADNQLKLF